jgi:zinc/manganese transport system substrate-binding protein
MKKILLILGFILVGANAEARVTILACEPEWAGVAKQIVKTKADIITATNSSQNPRNVIVKTPLVSIARGADMMFCSGNDLESKWINYLINSSANFKFLPGEITMLYASEYVGKKQIPQGMIVDRPNQLGYLWKGERVHLNPHYIAKIAAEFTRRIKIIDPLNSIAYQANYDSFITKWNKAILRWELKAEPLKGLKFIANDNSWSTLAEWLGLQIITLRDPTTGAKADQVLLSQVIQNLRTNPVEAIIFGGYEDKKTLLWMRDKTKIRVVWLPFTIGAGANSQDIFQFFETTVNALLTDCSKRYCTTLAKPKEVIERKLNLIESTPNSN